MRGGRSSSCGTEAKQSVSNGMFLGSGLLGKKKWIGHINRRSAKLILFVSFSVRHGEKQEEQSSQNMFLLYGGV
jgi:hypothetical protein